MKILIVGNGFDLAHYLPTAYAHFMGVMQAIENLPEDKDEVTFDDLFAGLEQSNSFFFGRTREIYDGDNLKFDVDKIYELKEKLQDNKWYAFFKKHLELDTWIDFEQKIDFVLREVYRFYERFLFLRENVGVVEAEVKHSAFYTSKGDILKNIKLDSYEIDLMNSLGVLDGRIMGGLGGGSFYQNDNGNISKIYIENIYNFIFTEFIRFKDIFDLYCFEVVRVFKASFFGGLGDFKEYYSFNYTQTLCDFYGVKIGDVRFLHGQAGNINKKIVMGVSDVSEGLKDISFFGFAKYHQKLFYDTDYDFLKDGNSYCSNIALVSKRPYTEADKVEIIFWGHSLNKSDSEYVIEIFDLIPDQRSDLLTVKVFFYDEKAKFSMLSNLIGIVGKEKIERWMKKGWLKFEKAPDLYELNFKKKDDSSV